MAGCANDGPKHWKPGRARGSCLQAALARVAELRGATVTSAAIASSPLKGHLVLPGPSWDRAETG